MKLLIRYYVRLALIILSLSISIFAQDTSAPNVSISNGQVYLTWSTYYQCHYEVLRSTISDGYFSVIVSHLTDPQWVDSPERGHTYYYRIVKYDPETKEIKESTRVVGVVVP